MPASGVEFWLAGPGGRDTFFFLHSFSHLLNFEPCKFVTYSKNKYFFGSERNKIKEKAPLAAMWIIDFRCAQMAVAGR